MSAKRKTVACLGGGVIGAGWAARFAHAGMRAVGYDPDPAAPNRVRAVLENARLARMNLLPESPEDFGEVRFANSIAEACEGADFAPGKRAGARGVEGGAFKRGRRRPARANRFGVLHLRAFAQPPAGGNEASGALVRRASV